MALKKICKLKDLKTFLHHFQNQRTSSIQISQNQICGYSTSATFRLARFSCSNCGSKHTKPLQNSFLGTAQFSSSSRLKGESLNLTETTSPQGIQGDIDCEINKRWHTNLTRSIRESYKDQIQGIQGSQKSLSHVISEQDVLLRDIIVKIEAVSEQQTVPAVQGIQGDFTAFPQLNYPCPQGVQGEDCIQYKLWLENCYKYGIEDCIDQFKNLTAGRKTLQQIFAEQEREIRHVGKTYQIGKIQRRSFSTTALVYAKVEEDSKENSTQTSENNLKAGSSELTGRQKLKNTIKDYGATVIVFHVSISLMSLGFFYTLVSSGLDVIKFLQMLGIGESIIQGQLAKGATTFALAYAVHKVFAPLRIATTVTCTPLIVRYLRNRGILKTPKKAN